MHVLVDLADPRLSREIVEILERAGHAIVRGQAFDVALVGTAEVAAKLRKTKPAAAIIVVTKLGDVPARIRALDAGADDAFDAGFAPSQMVARVGAVGRRAALTPAPIERVEIVGCTIDLSAATATRDGATTALTTREVELVRWLSARPGQIASRGELLQHVWRVSPASETRAVDVAIAALRQKLGPDVIVSVRGAGYRWG
ncbi:MAG TPA: response regulator transcription factor [Kofleriaceae bacterium]|jgi:DNA-binding response OmpR family regulator